jgi:hypothetical protein
MQERGRTDGVANGRLIVLIVLMSVVVWLVSVALEHSPGGVYARIVAISNWFMGGPKPAVVTWPAWGYAWLLALTPTIGSVILIQACVGIFAIAALADRLWICLPRYRLLAVVMLVLAVPWHTIQVDLYPSAFAGSLALSALLALDCAIQRNSIKWALAAGTLAGIGQNFRTEFVLLPPFVLLAMTALRWTGAVRFASIKPLLVVVAIALLFQLPWAVFYRAETGRYSLTESNFGHVLYVSMGSRADNPWGARSTDAGAQAALDAIVHQVSSLSDQGSRLLVPMVWQMARQHPGALAQRTIQQLKNTVIAPFSWGEPRLDERGKLDLDVLREELKSRIGVGVNVEELSRYRAEGLLSDSRRNPSAVAALAYQTVTVGLGSVVLVSALAGMVIVLMNPAVRPETPLLFLLACAAVYKLLQDVLLAYQVNYLSNVYPMLVPFAAIAWGTAACGVRRMCKGMWGKSGPEASAV